MYAKIFIQILDSSIAENHIVRHIFQDLLIVADPTGVVDMTLEALQRRLNVPIDMLTSAMSALSAPDPNSRSKVDEGRRIVLLDPTRSWGWQIVNFDTYHKMKDENGRREQNRINQQQHRERRRLAAPAAKGLSAHVSTGQHESSHTDANVDVDKEKILLPPDGASAQAGTPAEEPQKAIENAPSKPVPSPKRPKPKEVEIIFPPTLDNPQFRAVWQKWLLYRTEIKKELKSISLQSQLTKLGNEGVTSATLRINRAIENSYLGLWFKDDPTVLTAPSATGKPTPYDPMAAQASISKPRTSKE